MCGARPRCKAAGITLAIWRIVFHHQAGLYTTVWMRKNALCLHWPVTETSVPTCVRAVLVRHLYRRRRDHAVLQAAQACRPVLGLLGSVATNVGKVGLDAPLSVGILAPRTEIGPVVIRRVLQKGHQPHNLKSARSPLWLMHAGIEGMDAEYVGQPAASMSYFAAHGTDDTLCDRLAPSCPARLAQVAI
jgi:hypothetical protein